MSVLAVAALLSGCGSSDRPGLDDGSELGDLGTTNDENGAREAARAYLDAWVSGNASIACGLLTPTKARGIGMQFGDGTCQAAVTNLRNRMSESLRETYENAQITEVELYTVDDKPSATVQLSAELEGPLNGKDSFRFLYQAGRWQTVEEPEANR
ncbi:hypothetical protein L3Q67_38360 [Saccharothrix sp. AJ9571]|nr:hypothetical protein L3Q67_38360 [Saccharothrix sp. AJ9571]